MAETQFIIVLDSVTTSGQTVLPIKTYHIVCAWTYSSRQKQQNVSTTSRNKDIAETPVLSYLPLAAKL
jgi:hypothetical protein